MEPHAIDRIDTKGNIRGHLTLDDERTLCGLDLMCETQEPAGNGSCKRCEQVAVNRGLVALGPWCIKCDCYHPAGPHPSDSPVTP